MKKKILLVLTILFISSINAQSASHFLIQGSIKNLKEGTYVFLTINNKDLSGLDTVSRAIVKNGKFKMEGVVKGGADWYFLKVPNQKDLFIFLLENANVTITGSMDKWPALTVNGSALINDWSKFNREIGGSVKKLESLQNSINKTSDPSEIESLNREIQTTTSYIDESWKDYIEKHPDSYYSAFLLSIGGALKIEEKIMYYNKLTLRVKSSKFGISLKQTLDIQEKNAKIKVGKDAPDFTSFTPEGTPLSFKEAISKSKLTLIDFWGSWCPPCRETTPNIRKVYEAFHDKGFNVLSISLDSDGKAWREAIEKDNMPWLHMCELKGRNETAGKIYGINGVPAFFLVNQEGKILSLDLPGSNIPQAGPNLRGDGLYKTISKALGIEVKETDYERDNKAFMEENKKRKEITQTASGLQYEIIKMGSGAIPTLKSKVRVHYTGTFINGKKFDSSVDRGKPFETSLDQVIAGWTEALQLMPVGSTCKIYIPASLGYGDRDTDNIPSGSTLIFTIDLLDIL